MVFRILADVVVVVHVAFVAFVVAGGFAVLRWPRLAWLHLPCATWGALISFAGWVCPLTPLENRLRVAAGSGAYAGGFVEHYLVPLLYPATLTRGTQIAIGVAVVAVNAAAYTLVAGRRRRARRK